MDNSQGLGQAGNILLLVGAIFAAIGAVFFGLFAIGFSALFAALTNEPEAAAIGIIYGALAVLYVASAVLNFMAYNRSRENDADGAFLFGLIAAMLPPVRVFTLLGAIFCKVDENQAE